MNLNCVLLTTKNDVIFVTDYTLSSILVFTTISFLLSKALAIANTYHRQLQAGHQYGTAFGNEITFSILICHTSDII